jgi:hypothetical protein
MGSQSPNPIFTATYGFINRAVDPPQYAFAELGWHPDSAQQSQTVDGTRTVTCTGPLTAHEYRSVLAAREVTPADAPANESRMQLTGNVPAMRTSEQVIGGMLRIIFAPFPDRSTIILR